MASRVSVSVKDLVSASSEKLEPLPTHSREKLNFTEKAENEWLEEMTEKADRADAESGVQFAVGQYHFSHQNYSEALKYFDKAAASGTGGSSSQARYQLGVMYYDGLGVTDDPVKGSEYMLQVATSGDKRDSHIISSAQYNIGRAYFMGFGVPQSDDEAEKWWGLASTHDNDPSSIRAMHTLGLYYSRQESQSLDKSLTSHLKAATAGSPESMAAAGVMMIQGQGCARNEEEGLEWLKKSAKNDSVYGQGLLSRQYLAMKLFTKAAEAGFRVSEIEHPTDDPTPPLSKLECIGIATGCFVLARCMQLGNAVVKDEAKAMTYYHKAKRMDKSVTIELHSQLTQNQL